MPTHSASDKKGRSYLASESTTVLQTQNLRTCVKITRVQVGGGKVTWDEDVGQAKEIDLHLGILIKQPIKICIHLRPKVRGRVQDEILTLVQSRAVRVAMQHI